MSASPPKLQGVSFDALIAYRVFDADRLRADLNERDAPAIIPPTTSRDQSINYDKEFYKWPHLVENVFQKIKAFRRIATRYY